MRKAKYFYYDEMRKVEIPADSIRLEVGSDYYELQYRKSDGEISVTTGGTMIIEPRAANTIRIKSVT